MTTERATTRERLEETKAFVERALVDFELSDAFRARSRKERESCIRWVDAALGERAQEERVSEVLDCLVFGRPLPGL
jgi:hypothetical protein